MSRGLGTNKTYFGPMYAGYLQQLSSVLKLIKIGLLNMLRSVIESGLR